MHASFSAMRGATIGITDPSQDQCGKLCATFRSGKPRSFDCQIPRDLICVDVNISGPPWDDVPLSEINGKRKVKEGFMAVRQLVVFIKGFYSP